MNILLILALLLPRAMERGPHPRVVTVRVPEPVQLFGGDSAEARIGVVVAEGYHLQANPASEDYLVPTRLEIKNAGGLSIDKLVYPTGKPYRLNGADKEIQTYEGKFDIKLLLTASGSVRPGERVLQGILHYQACDSKTCLFPDSVTLQLKVNVVSARKRGWGKGRVILFVCRPLRGERADA